MTPLQSQLEYFSEEQTFDLFIARYHPNYQHCAKYVEKKTLGYNLTAKEILNLEDKLKNLNEDNFNIYLRPTNYINSNLIILDDYYSDVMITPEHLKTKLEFLHKDFSLEFSILTSWDKDKKHKEKSNKEYNYQLGIEFNPNIHSQQKSFLLTALCEKLECDSNHAKISKYLRAAGFYNKKYWPLKNQLDEAVQKNTYIEYSKHKSLWRPNWSTPEIVENDIIPEPSGLLEKFSRKFKR